MNTNGIKTEIINKLNYCDLDGTELNKMLFQSLELKMDLHIISRIINKGANINEPIEDLFLTTFPLTIALKNKLDLQYIKLLDTTFAGPLHKIGIMDLYKPTDDIVTFLLSNMDDSYLKQWEADKWNAEFWKTGVTVVPKIISPNFNMVVHEQVVGKPIRSEPLYFYPNKAILINPSGAFQIIEYDIYKFGFNKILNTEYTDGISITWLDDHGYKLAIICKDLFEKGDRYNVIASLISFKNLCGPCLLVDDDINLTFEDLSKIINLSKNFDMVKYRIECQNNMDELLKYFEKRKK
ncbi:hypothetical protein Catovirus_1_102 [Catovirus CTV1]|uniref:Uncharacterized protein n=1 Tax=Catovirus CTV1 TaxID=1977631 RepID=A0A1V0S8M1_9VIRU|nr:hypothetical protein Catovirus_1_102 [Catovirus CTV1]